MPKDMILGRARQPHGGKITYASFHLGFAFSVLARFVLKTRLSPKDMDKPPASNENVGAIWLRSCFDADLIT